MTSKSRYREQLRELGCGTFITSFAAKLEGKWCCGSPKNALTSFIVLEKIQDLFDENSRWYCTIYDTNRGRLFIFYDSEITVIS